MQNPIVEDEVGSVRFDLDASVVANQDLRKCQIPMDIERVRSVSVLSNYRVTS